MGVLNVNTINSTAGRSLAGVSGTIVDAYYCSSFAQHTVLSTTGDGTRIPDLILSIKPKRTTNRIFCEWAISGEIHHNTSFRIHRRTNAGSWGLITTGGEQGYNNAAGAANWSGLQSGYYDGNNSSTPTMNHVTYTFIAGTTEELDLALALTSPAGQNNQVNRTFDSWGQTNYETTMSYAYLYEIYV